MEVRLDAFDQTLISVPGMGGSIVSWRWQGLPMFRERKADCVLDTACFPLVPFSNRIANSRFAFGGKDVVLKPNHPDGGGDPVLHGFGWLGQWVVDEMNAHRLTMSYEHQADGWPWAFTAKQSCELGEEGLEMRLSVRNDSTAPMPAGLGFHPFFELTPDCVLFARHKGEWQNDPGSLPVRLERSDVPQDWWNGQPIGSRIADTVYTEREGDLTLTWPSRGVELVIRPCDDLPFTVIYTPEGEDYFCAEPVSHMTDAFNADRDDSGMRVLRPGEVLSAAMHMQPRRIQ